MTREETIKLLAILKAAYPNSYKGMTKEEANGTIATWQLHFAKMPANVVFIALNQIISVNQFPPTISEVRKKIRNLYAEAVVMLRSHEDSKLEFVYNDGTPQEEVVRMGEPLDDKTVAVLKQIVAATQDMRNDVEMSMKELFNSGTDQMLLFSGCPAIENESK